MNEKAPIVQTSNDTTKKFAALENDVRALFSRCPGGALLIGVEDYKAFDGSGKKDLLAGQNDVLAWWKVCRRLGFTRIRLLTSPVLKEEDIVRAEMELVPELHPGETEKDVKERVGRWLKDAALAEPKSTDNESDEQLWARLTAFSRLEGGVSLRSATAAEILDGAEWLASTLTLDGESKSLPGIMTYSGHGAQGEGDLVLCPTDTGPRLENAVPFATLRGRFATLASINGGADPTDNLTIFLDCCFAGLSDPSGKKGQLGTTLTPTASTGKVPVAKTEIGNRVFCASGREEQSYQAMLGGHWHGAFTWAITVALEQWKLEKEGVFERSTMSHAELLIRARMLLQALSFQQHPMLAGELGNLPVFHRGAADGDKTSADPTAKRTGIQMDPGGQHWAVYTLKQGSTVFASVLVVTQAKTINNVTYSAGKEHWSIVSDPRADTDITITCATGPWADPLALPNGFPASSSARPWRSTTYAQTWQANATQQASYWSIGAASQLTWSSGTPQWWSRAAAAPAADAYVVSSSGTTTCMSSAKAPSSTFSITNTFDPVSVAGRWSWFSGATVTIANGGFGPASGTASSSRTHDGNWTFTNGSLVITWYLKGDPTTSTTSVDTLTLSANRATLSGTNNGNPALSVSGTYLGA